MNRDNLKIKEIYQLVSKGKFEPFYSSQYFYRYISVIHTYLFIKLGIWSNPTTIISLIVALTGAFLIHLGNVSLMITGIILLNYYTILDHVDGELARFEISILKRKKGPEGPFLDAMVHYLFTPIVFFALGLKVFNETDNEIFLWLGVITFIWLSSFSQAAALRVSFDYLFRSKGSLEEVSSIWSHDKATDSSALTDKDKLRKVIRELFSSQGQIIIITAVLLSDHFFLKNLILSQITLVSFASFAVIGIIKSLLVFYKRLRSLPR